MTNLFLKLNNYDFSTENVNKIKMWITNNRPRIYNKHFRDMWSDFIVENGKLIYKPAHLIVVEPELKQQVLEEVYNKLTSSGQGISKFYHTICLNYVGIRREDVEEFLIHQQSYQLSHPFKHHINKPILSYFPNERWAIDLIDMQRYKNVNRNYIYILSCIDYFTKKIWLKGLKHKTAEDVVHAMNEIVQESTVYPKIIQKDNGGEFQGELNDWMNEHDIKFINTLSYSPQSNGLIESTNNQIRRILREISIRTNSLNWIDQLKTVCDDKNNQKSNATKYTPNQLWTPTNSEVIVSNGKRHIPFVHGLSRRQIQEQVVNRIRESAVNKLSFDNPFSVGDLVRVKMNALYSQVRAMIKNHDKKFVVVSYSPTIFKISKILKMDNVGYENKRYYLEYLDGEPLITQLKKNNPNATRINKRFFASDFLKVDSIPKKPLISITNALKLNKTQKIIIEKPDKEPIKIKRNIEQQITEPIPERMELRNNRKQNEILNYSRTNRKINKLEQLNDDLKGKEFNDEDDRFKILNITFSKKYNEYVCDVVNVKDIKKNGELKTNHKVFEQSVKEILQLL